MEVKRLCVQGSIVTDLFVKEAPNPQRVFLLLHGYQESGQKIFKKCVSFLPENSLIIAPNGPFPLPEKKEEKYEIGFAWYFFDNIKMQYFIDMDIPTLFLSNLIKDLALGDLPMTMIGFSQGGYLAPVAAQHIPQVDHVIGIGCRFRRDKVVGPIRYRLDGIHGDQDSIVGLQNAKKAFLQWKEEGVQGDFYTIPGLGHRIDQEVKDLLKKLTFQ